MTKALWTLLTLATAWGISPLASGGTVTFSGAVAYNANADGSWNHSGITATGGCCQLISVEKTTFNNGGSTVALPFALTLGTDVLFLETSDWTTSFGVTTGGVNLFFDGNTTPGISADTTPTGDKTAFPAFSVIASGKTTASLSDSNVNSSGSLSFDDGTDTVTLTGLQWVRGDGSNPYNANDTVQKVTLSVTADSPSGVPEPASLLLIGSGLGVLALLRRLVGEMPPKKNPRNGLL